MEYIKEDYIKYRLKKAEETYLAAKVLYEKAIWNSVINRLYYACFYAINALLVKKKIKAQTHSGMRSQFSLYFIKTKIFKKQYGKLYSDLFDSRQRGDYSDFYDFDKETIDEFMIPVRELLSLIKKYIEEEN